MIGVSVLAEYYRVMDAFLNAEAVPGSEVARAFVDALNDCWFRMTIEEQEYAEGYFCHAPRPPKHARTPWRPATG